MTKRAVWLLNRVALAAHGRQLAEHGGQPGVDPVRLTLAMGWPRTVLSFAGARLTLFDLAAAYCEGILRVRPFESGNERMGYLLSTLFLAVNGVLLPASASEQMAMFHAFRMGAIDRTKYAQWMLMRQLAQRGGAVIGVRRDRSGRVLSVGMLVTKSKSEPVQRRIAGRKAEARAVPMLQN